MSHLVLSRQPKQQIMIGDDITITVLEVRSSGQVRLGFEAPESVVINRREVYDAIQAAAERGEGQ